MSSIRSQRSHPPQDIQLHVSAFREQASVNLTLPKDTFFERQTTLVNSVPIRPPVPATSAYQPQSLLTNALYLQAEFERLLSKIAPCFRLAFEAGITGLDISHAVPAPPMLSHNVLELDSNLQHERNLLATVIQEEEAAYEQATDDLYDQYYQLYQDAVSRMSDRVHHSLKAQKSHDSIPGSPHASATESPVPAAPVPLVPTQPRYGTRAAVQRRTAEAPSTKEHPGLRGDDLRGEILERADLSAPDTPPRRPLDQATITSLLDSVRKLKTERQSAAKDIIPFKKHALYVDYETAVEETHRRLRMDFRARKRVLNARIAACTEAHQFATVKAHSETYVSEVVTTFLQIESTLLRKLKDYVELAYGGLTLKDTMEARVTMSGGEVSLPYTSNNLGACLANLSHGYNDQNFSGFVSILIQVLQKLIVPNQSPSGVMQEINQIVRQVDQMQLHSFFNQDSILTVVALSGFSLQADQNFFSDATNHITRYAKQHSLGASTDVGEDRSMPLLQELNNFLHKERKESATRAVIQQHSAKLISSTPEPAPRSQSQYHRRTYPRTSESAAVVTETAALAAALPTPRPSGPTPQSTATESALTPAKGPYADQVFRSAKLGIPGVSKKTQEARLFPYTATYQKCSCTVKACGCYGGQCKKCEFWGHKTNDCKQSGKNPQASSSAN